jgi:hypothetical protein
MKKLTDYFYSSFLEVLAHLYLGFGDEPASCYVTSDEKRGLCTVNQPPQILWKKPKPYKYVTCPKSSVFLTAE